MSGKERKRERERERERVRERERERKREREKTHIIIGYLQHFRSGFIVGSSEDALGLMGE